MINPLLPMNVPIKEMVEIVKAMRERLRMCLPLAMYFSQSNKELILLVP